MTSAAPSGHSSQSRAASTSSGLKVMDDFEHAHPAMAGNEGLKLFCRLVELLGRHPVGDLDLDGGEVVHLLVRQHASLVPY
jgi:hypothetical protein